MSTCKDCEDRHYNCHSGCEDYEKERKAPFKEDVAVAYWSDRTRKIEHKKFMKRKR